MQGILIGYQGAFEQYKAGALPAQDWALVRLILRSFWLFDGKAKNDAWEQMARGEFFNKDFLQEVANLKEEAMRYREKLDEVGLQL